MQPDANRSRALAMSVRGVSTFTPTASIDPSDRPRQQQIEIVNHQVEDHVDVEAALGERAEAVNFDEARIADHQRQRRRDRRVEPLGVTGGQHRAARARPPRSGDRRRPPSRHRLLHQHRDARSRNGSATSTCDSVGTAIVTASTSIQQLARSRPRLRATLAGDLVGAARLDVHDADQLDAVHRGQQPRVMLAEMTDADHRDA